MAISGCSSRSPEAVEATVADYLMMLVLLIGLWPATAAHAVSTPETLAQLEAAVDTNDEKTALKLLEQIAPEVDRLSRADQGRYLVMQGIIQEDIQRDINSADRTFNRVIDMLGSLPQPSQPLADAYYERAYIKYIRTHNTAEYCPDREKAVALTRALNTRSKLAKYLTALSFCYADPPARFRQGLALLNEAMTLAEAMRLKPAERGLIYNATAILYRSNQLYGQAYEYSRLAYDQWKVENTLPSMDTQQHNMLVNAIDMGELDKAEQHGKELFALAAGAPQYKEFAFFAYYDTAQVAFARNDLPRAIRHFEQARSEEHNTAEALFIADNRAQLAMAYVLRGDVEAGLREAAVVVRLPGYTSLTPDKKQAVQGMLRIRSKEPVQAMQVLLSLYRSEQQRRQQFLKNSTLEYASRHDNRIQNYEKQLLESRVQIQQLELSSRLRQQEASRLFLTLAAVTVLSLSLLAVVLWRSRRKFRNQAQTDALTGIANRRHFIKCAHQAARRHRKQPAIASVLMLDIDHFKRINDTYGHQVGDAAIRHVAVLGKAYLRDVDIFGRTGGEEFAVLLPEMDESAAWQMAERIRQGIEREAFEHRGDQIHITVSIGVATGVITDDSIEGLMQRADHLMYRAKRSGRNRSCSHAGSDAAAGVGDAAAADVRHPAATKG
jgi:diguanylate cyclase (GGDEF)-like protein